MLDKHGYDRCNNRVNSSYVWFVDRKRTCYLSYILITRVSKETNRTCQALKKKYAKVYQHLPLLSIHSGRVSIHSGRVSIQLGRVSIHSGRVSIHSGRVSIHSGRVSIHSGRVSIHYGRVSIHWQG